MTLERLARQRQMCLCRDSNKEKDTADVATFLTPSNTSRLLSGCLVAFKLSTEEGRVWKGLMGSLFLSRDLQEVDEGVSPWASVSPLSVWLGRRGFPSQKVCTENGPGRRTGNGPCRRVCRGTAQDGGMRRFILAVMGKGEDRHHGLCLSGTPATQGRKVLV